MTSQSQTCEHCASPNDMIFDTRRLCCAARFLDTLPTYESMVSTGRKLCADHGHDPKALSDAVKARKRARLERVLAETAPR